MTSPGEKSFAPTEREHHKKQQRVHNSLGALLSGLGSNTGNQNNKSDSDANSSSNNQNNSNSGQPKKEENFQSRKRVNYRIDTTEQEPYTSTKADFGWCAAAPDMEGQLSSDAVEQQQPQEERHQERQQEPYDNANKKRRMDESFPNEFDHWGETRKFDDDLDKEWLDHQHKELDEKYGEGIITVKYTEQGTLGYYCELCFAVMNAVKPLEMHCSGMKHLKKKDIYDKSKASGGTMLLMERSKPLEPPNVSSTSRGRSDLEPPSSRYSKEGKYDRSREGNYDRDRYGRDDYYNRDRYSREDSRDPFGRGGYGSLGGGRERDPYRNERDYRDYGRDPYGRGRDRYDGADRLDPYADRYRKDDLRGHPSDRPYSSGHSRPDELHQPSDRLPPYSDDRLPHKDDRSPYGTDRPRSGEMSRHSADRSYPGSNSRHSADYWDDRRSQSSDIRPKVPSPPPAKIPAPPPIINAPPVETDTSLAGGPAATLLTKLAQCTVKNENDADLASNVINLLLKSLKEYNAKLGEKSVADLMEQAEIKLGTAKAIRTVRKPTAVSNPLEAISLAMNTLRRANADKPPEFSLMFNSTSSFQGF